MDYRYGLRYKEDNDMDNEKDCASSETADDGKGAPKRGAPQTRGTAISFGFRRRSREDGNRQAIKNYEDEVPQRSKSLGPEQVRRRIVDDDDQRHQRVQSASSGRSTPRLAPPKKEVVAGNVRMNRFGFRQPQAAKYTDKVADICSSHSASHFNQDKTHHQQHQQEQTHVPRSSARNQQYATPPSAKLRPSPVNNPPAYSHSNNATEINRKLTNIPEPVSKYTLHTSHLPLPQFAVRVADTNPKIAKTVANQNRKVSTASKSSAGSQSGSGTEDSGIGSQPGYLIEHEQTLIRGGNGNSGGMDYLDGASAVRRIQVRPRNLRMVVNGKSFDVRDVDDDNTVTEISVIPLPKTFASVNLNTGLVRERTSQYHQRITNNKDNRYCTTESITSMSTTSSEGYDEGLGEEKVFKDRSRSEKVPSIKSDFSPPSSDDPEYGHGEAMADEYSFSSSDECRANNIQQHLKTISNPAPKSSVTPLSIPKNTLRSVMLTIEDPAFAAAAASSTTLIDDETSPVDSLVDSLTASITQSDGQASKKEKIVADKCPGIIPDDDSPGTPTNASNSLSLSEGREYFDDEIADQPGLTFDDTMRTAHETHSGRISRQVTDSSNTLMEPVTKTHSIQAKNIENSPLNCRRISRTGSVDTLSPCESITSDDMMLDYERSETSSYDEPHRRFESSPAIHEMDDATILSELEAQGEEVMREWSSLLGTHPQISNSNLTNNNLISSNNNNINNQQISESGIGSARTSRLLRSRTGTDSPRSLDSVRTRQVASPFRPVLTGNGQSPSLDSGDEGSPRLERCNYQQDIVYIKTGLLKLMRIIQESEEKDLTRADTLNPFNNSLNGLFHNLNEDGTDSNGLLTNGALNIADELTDLRRQVIFLQGQLEDKDRAIQNLQLQVAKQQDLINSVDSQSSVSYASSSKDMSNAATQTEKIRPISAGPSLLQGFPQDNGMGPLVSWSETWNQKSSQRPLSLAEIGSNCASSGNVKSNRKIDRPRTVKSRHEQIQASIRLPNGSSNGNINGNVNSNANGVTELEKDKSQSQQNSVVRRIIKSRDSVTNQIIDDEFTKESKPEVPKSCIPSLKKVTTRVARQTNISINRSHNA
ncbi:uncharacterized protein LOC130676489 isoform X2 [Microplitis mediator]|uniref:uncharacterized protein LOC130676489 isoform X2 n=1 Tax=Microplitis mediator TaxID=375433 RepID=UPI002553FFA3|nr:uncharacterized protein LOC130676489 isoform X2 [Microplitis mediator]XP_057338739.1 uncharacterized protein LOC130676489 isoform X2 [Microplitis mediator]